MTVKELLETEKFKSELEEAINSGYFIDYNFDGENESSRNFF